MSKLLNFVGFQIGWFGCILGAANGEAWIGPTVVMLFLVATLSARSDPGKLAVRLIAAALIGVSADSLLARLGVLEWMTGGVMSPLWMVALWPNLAAALGSSLGWLAGRYGLAAVLGAIAGPASYYGGAQLGALKFSGNITNLIAVAVEWMIALPLLVLLTDRRHAVAEVPA
jgi:hypothetical protein